MGENSENQPLPMANMNVKETISSLNKMNKSENDKHMAYSFLASSLDSQKDTAKTIQQYSPQLFKYLSRDVLCQEPKVFTVVTKIILYCFKDKQFLESVTKDETKSLLLAVLKAGKEKQSEENTKQVLCILTQQKLSSDLVMSHVPDILDTLESIYTEGNGKNIILPNILEVIYNLHETIAQDLKQHAQRWCRMVFPCLGYPLASIRTKSFDLLKHYRSSLLCNLELGKYLLKTVDSDLGKPLASLVAKDPLYVMDAWSFILDIVGKALHKGSTINVMLEIIENGFKGSPESRIAAFKAWRSLIDNFALEQDVISDPKRIRLVMMVLKTNNAKTEAVALEKLKTWWHFVRSIGNKLSSVLEQILYPLLQFCVGNVNQPSQIACPSPNFALKLSSPCASKALASIQSRMGSQQLPSFTTLQKIGFEVIAHLVSRPNENGKAHGVKWTIDPLPIDVLASSANFVKHAPFIMSSLEALLKSIGSQDRESLIVHIWTNLSAHLKAALEKGGKVECRDVFSAFLSHFYTLVQADFFQPQMLVTLFKSTCDFPDKVLSSTLYNTGAGTTAALKGCPALLLCEILFMPALLKVSSEEETFLKLFSGIVSSGASKQQGALFFIQAVTDILDSASAKLSSTDLLYRLWNVLADALLDVVIATNEVNQGDALEYNFGCLYAVLLLPVQHQLASKVSQGVCKSMVRVWKELYHIFARLSALVTNAEANTCLEEISSKVIGVWRPDFKDPSNLEYLASVGMKMLDCADFSAMSVGRKQTGFTMSPSKWTKRRQRPMSNLHSFVHMLEKMQMESNTLFDQFGNKSFTQKQSGSPGCILSYTNHLIDIYTHLFTHIPGTVVSHVLSVLASPMSRLFNKAQGTGAVKIFVPSVLSKLEKLWFEICSCVTGRYTEQYDSSFLATLSPLLEVTFPHPRRAIKSQTLTLWSSTFSKSVGLTYPESLKPILSIMKEKTAIVLPGWITIEDNVIAETPFSDVSQSQGDSQVPAPILSGFPSPKRLQKGSFLHKDLSPARKSPAASKVSPAKIISPKDAKTLFSSCRNLSSELNLMSDKDFVVISSPTKRRRVLTEHQKEVLKEKRIIPAMYNNLDASQDTSLMAQLNAESQQESMSCTDVIVIHDSQSSQLKEKITVSDSHKDNTSGSNSGGFTIPKQVKLPTRRRSTRIKEMSNDEEIEALNSNGTASKKTGKSILKESEKMVEEDGPDKQPLISSSKKNENQKHKNDIEMDNEEDMVLSSLETSCEMPLNAPKAVDTTNDKIEVPAFGMFRTKDSSPNNLQSDTDVKNNSCISSESKPRRISLRKIKSQDGESSVEAPAVLKMTEQEVNIGKSPRRVPLQRIHDQKSTNQSNLITVEPEKKKSDLQEDKTEQDSETVVEPKKTRSALEKWLAKSNPPTTSRRESPRKKRKFSDVLDDDSQLEKSPNFPVTLVEDTQSPGKVGKPHLDSASIAETPLKSDDSPSPVIRSVRKLFADDESAKKVNSDTPKISDVIVILRREDAIKNSQTDLNKFVVENEEEVTLSQGFTTNQEESETMTTAASLLESETLKSSSKEKYTNTNSHEMPQSENLFASSEGNTDSMEPWMAMQMPTLASQTKDLGIGSSKLDSSSSSRTSSSVESDPKDKPMSSTESEFDPSQATLNDDYNKISSVIKKKNNVRETLASTRTRRSNIKRKDLSEKFPEKSSSKLEDQMSEGMAFSKNNQKEQEAENSSEQGIVDAVVGSQDERKTGSQKLSSNKNDSTSEKESNSQSSLEKGEVTPVVKSTNENSSQRCSTTKKKRLVAKQLSEHRQQGLKSSDASKSESVDGDVKSEKFERKSAGKLGRRMVSSVRRRISPTVSPPRIGSKHMLRIRTKPVKKLSQSPPSKRGRFENKNIILEDSSSDEMPLSSLVQKEKSIDASEKETADNEEVTEMEKEISENLSDDQDETLAALASAIAKEKQNISEVITENDASNLNSTEQVKTCEPVAMNLLPDVMVDEKDSKDNDVELTKGNEVNVEEKEDCFTEVMLSTIEEIPPGQADPPMEIESSDQSTGSDEVFKDTLNTAAVEVTGISSKDMEVDKNPEENSEVTVQQPVDETTNEEEGEDSESAMEKTDESSTIVKETDEDKCDDDDSVDGKPKGDKQDEQQKDAQEFVLSDWSPSKSPSCSILRKQSTPSSGEKGRRKVSFAEPVVSGESPVREKYHSESLPTSPLICHTYSMALTRPGSPGIKPIKGNNYRRRLDTSLKKQVHSNLRQRSVSSPTSSPTSQNSYKATQESQLDSVNPIFPDLVDCKTSLDCILPQLTSSLWFRGLCQLMKGRNLHTIGDLSALTEFQVNQMPIRCPKVDTVRVALTNYQNQHGGLSTPKSQSQSKSIFGNATPSLEVSNSPCINQGQGTPRSDGATLSLEVTPSSIADEGIKILPSAEQDLSQLSPIKDPNMKSTTNQPISTHSAMPQVKISTFSISATPSLALLASSSSSSNPQVPSNLSTDEISASKDTTNIVSVLSSFTDRGSLSELKNLSMSQLFDVHQKLNNLFGVVVEEMKERSKQS